MKTRLALTLTVLFLLFGCSQQAPEPATPIGWEALDQHNNQRVALEGYLTVPRSVMANDTMLLPLKKEMTDDSPKVSLSTKVGTGNNQVEELPKKYEESDLKVRDHQGELVPVGSKIRVSGKLVGDAQARLLMGPLTIERL